MKKLLLCAALVTACSTHHSAKALTLTEIAVIYLLIKTWYGKDCCSCCCKHKKASA